MITAYNPTGNSISERIKQTITRVLQASQQTPIKMSLKMNCAFKNQYSYSLKDSPQEKQYGHSLFDTLHSNQENSLEIELLK